MVIKSTFFKGTRILKTRWERLISFIMVLTIPILQASCTISSAWSHSPPSTSSFRVDGMLTVKTISSHCNAENCFHFRVMFWMMGSRLLNSLLGFNLVKMSQSSLRTTAHSISFIYKPFECDFFYYFCGVYLESLPFLRNQSDIYH